MNRQDDADRPPRILATAEGLIPSVELVANVPFGLLKDRGQCDYRFRCIGDISVSDIIWADTIFLVRGSIQRTQLFMRKAKQLGRYLVSYWDDNFLCLPKDSGSYAHFSNRTTRAVIDWTMRHSDVLACTTDTLANAIYQHAARQAQTLVVPACGITGPPTRRSLATSPCVVVGYAGSTDHLPMLQNTIIPAMELLVQQGVNVCLEICGPQPIIPSSIKDRVKLHEFFQQYQDWLDFRNSVDWDISLAPLADGAFQRCKHHNKFLEMGMAGVPCIFSDIPVYRTVVRHCENGLLSANTPQAWADAIRQLAISPSLRTTIALNAWQQVCRDNGPEAVCQSYLTVLHDAMKYRRPK